MGDSIFTNLKNKVAYHVQKAVTDPDANKYAEEQKQKEEEAKKKAQEEEQAKKEATENTGDPNKFSGTRLVKKVGTQTLTILKWIITPFVALMLSMIIANELIIYPAPVRIIFFLFTFLLCFFLPFYAIILSVFYLLKGGYSYYVNNMTQGPKRNILPRIYSLLPITTNKPTTTLGAIFLAPFVYPKTDRGVEMLTERMNEYWSALVASFNDFDKFKNLQPIVEDVKKIKENFAMLHKPTSVVKDITQPTVETQPTNTQPEETAQESAQESAKPSTETGTAV